MEMESYLMIKSRRKFLSKLVCSGALINYPYLFSPIAAAIGQSEKLLVTVQLRGAWDTSSFCDPKQNISGEPIINHWAVNNQIRRAGNISFAPYSSNLNFFEKHHDKTLVINGVDTQTNSHQVGEIHTWSGRTSAGYPSLTALNAAVKGPELPMPYISIGGFSNTEGIVRSTQIGNPSSIRSIAFPNLSEWNSLNYVPTSNWERIKAAQQQSLSLLTNEQGLVSRNFLNRQYYSEGFSRAEEIQDFARLVPTWVEMQALGGSTALRQTARVALLAFKSGVSVAADLAIGGFDTHADHDRDHEPLLTEALDAVDFLWDSAEELGLADRLVVVMGSDFSRSPGYNAGQGKDHWPIGSYLVMEKNASYTNRVIGHTDARLNAHPINPNTLERDNFNGVIIKPAHVHKALRKYLGLENSDIAQKFPFDNTEDFSFFG